MTQPLIINTWQNAIADSPALGFGLIKNASIDAVPGTVMPNYAPVQHSFNPASSTFTWNISGTEDLTLPNTTLESDGIAVTFSTTGGGTLDTAILVNTVYYLYKFASGRVIIADTLAHAISHNNLALNGNGSGTCTMTTVDPGTFRSLATGGGADFTVDSNGLVWYDNGSRLYLLTGNTTTQASGQGIAFFTNSDASKNFIFVFRNAQIDVADVTAPMSPIWTNSWHSLSNGSGFGGTHQALLGQDNIIYACDGRYIVSIQEKPGSVFAPGTVGTYTYQPKALTLPNNESASCLEQLQINLLVGGGATNLIYPWDRSSPSFALPWVCPEIGIYGLKNIGNTIWILNGLRGNVYKSLGYIVTLVRKLPEYVMGNGSANVVQYGAVAAKSGALLFGVAAVSNNPNSGLYLMYPDGRLVLEKTPSQGAQLVTVISQSAGEFYKYGYAGGFDGIDTARYGSLGSVVIQSALYTVGTKTAKATFSQVEVQMDAPGGNGPQVRISYRTSLADAFTTLATYNTGSSGSFPSFNTDIGLTDIENIQIQVEIAGSANAGNAARVREVRLFP